MITQTSFTHLVNERAPLELAASRLPRPPLRCRLVTGASLHPSDLAPGLLLGADVKIADGVLIGGQVVIHSGVRIGAGARIGDHAQIRDGARIGAGSTIGSFSSVDPGVVVGERVSVQTRCYLTGGTVVEDDVFVGPGVTLTNDNTMDRHGPDKEFEGPLLRRACRIGGGAVLCPGVEIGEEAFVAAGAVVTADVAPRTVVVGVPARELRSVPDEDLLERWR
jgi:acetyltransferase-like isoleucine patch superfamily enzyme